MNLSEFMSLLPAPPPETKQQQRERYRHNKIARSIDEQERRWYAEEIQPKMDAGMSFDDAYVAAGGAIVDVVTLLGSEQSRLG